MNSLSNGSHRPMVLTAQRMLVSLAVCMALLLICLPASAQLNLGRIWGNIADQSGGVIAGATVTVLDVPRGSTRTLTTDSAGVFSASSLVPSTYTVRAEYKGFKTLERQNVEVGVGQEIRLDLTLQPGDQSQTVTVTELIPIIDTTNAVLSSTLQTETISELPINGRLFTKLLDYQRAEIRRTTKPTVPVARVITICLMAWKTATYSLTPDLLSARPLAPTN